MTDPLSIRIERRERHDIFVRAGDLFADSLCIDEAIATIAALLISGDRWYLRTYAEWASTPFNRMSPSEFAGLLPPPRKRETMPPPANDHRLRSHLGCGLYIEILPESEEIHLIQIDAGLKTTIVVDTDQLRAMNQEIGRLSALAIRRLYDQKKPPQEQP